MTTLNLTNFTFIVQLLHCINAATSPVLSRLVTYDETLYCETLYGETLYGETLYGETLYGKTLYGETLYGETLYGEILYGETLYGETLNMVRHYHGGTIYGGIS